MLTFEEAIDILSDRPDNLIWTEDELVDLVNRIDATPDVNSPALFYSGDLGFTNPSIFDGNPSPRTVRAFEVANALTDQVDVTGSRSGFVQLTGTDVGRFLASSELNIALMRTFADNAPGLEAFLFDAGDRNLFSIASANYAASVSGAVVTIVPRQHSIDRLII